jgi:AhpD family alkylhydroperoxidase
MTTFTLHTTETAPEGSKEQLTQVEKTWNFIPNLHRTLAESPSALKAYATLAGLVAQSSLEPAEQQVAYLAINVLSECEYCTSGHSVLAKMAGVQPEAIEALREGRPISDIRLEALRGFAEAVVRERGFVGGTAVDAFIAAGFTKAQVLEVVLIAATKTISNYTNHLTHTPLDAFMAETAWVAPRNRAAQAA